MSPVRKPDEDGPTPLKGHRAISGGYAPTPNPPALSYLLSDDPTVSYVGWTTHNARGQPTAWAWRVPREHAAAWRDCYDAWNANASARSQPGALYPVVRFAFGISERWPANGTIAGDSPRWPGPPYPNDPAPDLAPETG